jgi:hypothetical protein
MLKKPEGVTDEMLDLAVNCMSGSLEAFFRDNYQRQLSTEEIEWVAHYGAIEILVSHFNDEVTY